MRETAATAAVALVPAPGNALLPAPGNALLPVPIAASGAAAVAANNDVATNTATALPQVARKVGKQLSESERAQLQREQLQTCYAEFKCSCSIAKAQAATSCLDQFSKVQLQAFYTETYGSSGKEIGLADVSNALLTHIWALKVQLPAVDADGRKYAIPRWLLDGNEVCKKAGPWRI